MGPDLFGTAVAGLAALAHVYLACLETLGWGPATVRKIAPAWVEGTADTGTIDAHVAWAKQLAFNVGAYNLLLATGLAWTAAACAKGAAVAGPLAVFFAIWLLGAAAAALYTRVVKAFALQGLLGLALLAASLWI